MQKESSLLNYSSVMEYNPFTFPDLKDRFEGHVNLDEAGRTSCRVNKKNAEFSLKGFGDIHSFTCFSLIILTLFLFCVILQFFYSTNYTLFVKNNSPLAHLPKMQRHH